MRIVASEPFVVRHRRRDDALHPERGVGLGVAERDVDPRRRNRRRAGEIHLDRVARDRRRRHEIDRAVVAVDPHARAVDAGCEPGDRFAHSGTRALEDVRPERAQVVDAELVEHREQAPGADLVAGDERIEVADHLIGRADVGAHELEQRLVHLPGAREAHQRHVQPLLEHVARVRAHPEAADVDDVRGRREQRDQAVAPERRRHEREVVQMPGPLPRIVGREDVARAHRRGGELREEVADRARHGVHVAGRPGDGLREHVARGVEDPGRDVARFARRGGEPDADQRLRLLLDDREQPVPHQLQADGVEGAAHAGDSIRCPNASTRAIRPAGTRVVVSASATSAGPRTRWPGWRSARTWSA